MTRGRCAGDTDSRADELPTRPWSDAQCAITSCHLGMFGSKYIFSSERLILITVVIRLGDVAVLVDK